MVARLLCSLLFVDTYVNAQKNVSKDEREVQLELLQAIEKRDTKALQAIMTNDFSITYANGTRETKEELVSRWRSNAQRDSLHNIYTYGVAAATVNDKIILAGIVVIEKMENNKFSKTEQTYKNVCRKVGGAWKISDAKLYSK